MVTGVIIAAILAVSPAISVSATTNTYDAFRNLTEEEKEIWFSDFGDNRPAINPDFAPDQDCNIAYEVKCIPGSQQSCFDLDGFDNGKNNVCSPIECQEGYHMVDDDETGLCYPNSEVDCDDSYVVTYDGKQRYDYVFVEGEDGESDRCANPVYLCEDESSHEICKEFLNNN